MVQEVEQLIAHAVSFRNRMLVLLLYATEMRLCEVARLRLEDINSKQMIIHIHNAKGAKDQFIPLGEVLLPILLDFFRRYCPVEYLFNGERSATPLSLRMIQHVACKARNIPTCQSDLFFVKHLLK